MSALKPDAVNTHDLGTTSLPWKALHVDEVKIGARSGVSGNKVIIGTQARLDADASDKVNVQIYGDLSVFGSQTTISSETLTVEDPLIKLGTGNTTDLKDIGFYGLYNDGTNDKFAGLFRDANLSLVPSLYRP